MSLQTEVGLMSDPRVEDAAAGGSSEAPRQALRILFATDGTDAAEAAGRFIKRLPLPPGSAVQIVSVVDVMGWPETPAWYLESGREWGVKTLEHARDALDLRELDVHVALRFGPRASEILHAAAEFHADVLALAAHRLSRMEAFWLGTITRTVAKHAHCPVLIAREPAHNLKRVVLAVDESAHSTEAADFVARLPLPAETEIVVVHVVRPYQPFPGLVPSDPTGFQREVETVRRKLHADGGELVERVSRRLEASGKRATTLVQEGDPAEEIVKLSAARNADLIVSGARGVSMIQGLLLGSVADRLLENAHCSVLLVR